MSALAVLLSLVTLDIDQSTLVDPTGLQSWLYTGGPEGVRTLLSTLAGSMITMASLIYSITLVALTLTTSQFGPRLLNNFMRDTANQVVLGTFVSTFIYSLLVLRTVRGINDTTFVPHLSVTVAVLLAITSLGLLIYFIHHVSVSLQVESVVADIERDLNEAIERLFPEKKRAVAHFEYQLRNEKDVPQDFEEEAWTIEATKSGYLQTIDNDGLVDLATEENLLLRIEHRPGEFVAAENVLVKVWSYERDGRELGQEINEAFILGAYRLRLQDVEYEIDQLVEIALRALSPGINDPFTAMACVDRLGTTLANLAERQIPSGYRYDEEGTLRLISEAVTFAGIVDSAFDMIRQHARSSTAVSIRLLEAIAVIAGRVRTTRDAEALGRQAEMICRGCEEALPEESDRQDVVAKYEQARRIIERSKSND